MPHDVSNLTAMLDRIESVARDSEQVSLRKVFDALGSRSFGPWLLVAGLVPLSPLSGVPGVATVMGAVVLLIAVQMLLHRRHFWLPRWVMERSLAQRRVQKAVQWMRRPARAIDRMLRPRLNVLVQGPGAHAVALVCMLIACSMVVMELVPLSATTAGAALTAFGLALIARDGLVALLAFLITGATFALAAWHLL